MLVVSKDVFAAERTASSSSDGFGPGFVMMKVRYILMCPELICNRNRSRTIDLVLLVDAILMCPELICENS